MDDKLKTDKFILTNKRKIWDNEEICKLAILQYGLSLCYVKPELMTDEICKLAVKQNGYALRYVKVQTEEICKLAIRQNNNAINFVKKELRTLELIVKLPNGIH